MVFKTLNLARQGLVKSLTYGYAQSVVAASQSSYASQHGTFGAFASGRLGKAGSQNHSAFSTVSGQAAPAAKAGHGEHHDGGLAAYYAAWHKQKLDEGKEWHQFQFAKRIEWKPPASLQDGMAKIDEKAPLKPERPVRDCAPTTAPADSAATAEAGEQAEAAAPALRGERAAEDGASSDADLAPSAGLSALAEEDVSRSPTAASETAPESIARSESTGATSVSSGADGYAEQLDALAATQNYGEIPAIFEAMLKAGARPTASAYNTLLLAAIHLPKSKHQVVPKALDVYSDMLRRRVVPNVTTYATLIELLSSRALDVIAMKQVLEDKRARYGGMEEAGKFMFHSEEAEFDILAEDDSLSLAVKMFEASNAIHAEGGFAEKTYGLLVTACAEAGRIEDMVRIFSYMESQNIIPRADVFVPMIQAFATSGDLRSSVECYDEYKALAVAHDQGEITMVRKDNDVYAALIKAYLVCGRTEGGEKFFGKIEAALPDAGGIGPLRDTVGLKAFVPELLKKASFERAFAYAAEKLSDSARATALAGVCIRAADKNSVEIATKAFDSLPEDVDISGPAMAMTAMHVRNGNLEAAEPFWRAIETAPAMPHFLEATTMRTIALIGTGQAELGLRQSRSMFAHIRDSRSGSRQAELNAAEQIDEAIEVIGQFMVKRGIVLPPKASAELMWTMMDNGGLVTPVAGHLLAGLGPEGIAQLGWDDLTLLVQVQAGMIINTSTLDIASAARFTHLLEVITASGMTVDQKTSTMIEKVVAKLESPDLAQRWHSYRYPTSEPVYSPVPFGAFPHGAPIPAPAYEDSFDPYAAATDNKGSVAITDLLEKTHGKSASHLNEALLKFKNMRRAGRHPRFFTYAKLITAAAKEDRLNLAHDILNLAKQDVPFVPQYRIVRYGWVTILDAMVSACLTTGNRQLAGKYHQDLLDMGAAPSANTFGLYITTLKESTKTFDEASEAVKIFLRAKAEGVEPSSFLYNALIGKLGKARRIDDCLFYFAEMRNLGIRPTSVTYGTIVNALCRVSDEKFAEELFEEMESMPNYKPRPAPYHSLMQFFLTTKRDRSKVLSYYERMRSKSIEPTTHTYKLLIDTHATLDPVDMPAAEAVLDQIRKAGRQPEAVHYASLIHAKGCVLHDMAGARKLFNSVMANPSVRPQACLYQALFEAMVANHQIQETESVLKDMRKRSVDMTPYIANSLIHGWALAKNIDKARAIYDSVAMDKREPSTYEAMTRAFMAVEDRASAMTVVNEGLSRGYPAAVAGKILELVGGGRSTVPVMDEATA